MTALEALSLDAGTTGSFTGSWTFADGVTGFDENTVCSAGNCGEGSDVRLGQTRLHPGVRSNTTPIHAPANGLAAGDFKMFILGGHDASGMNIESSFFSCTRRPRARCAARARRRSAARRPKAAMAATPAAR